MITKAAIADGFTKEEAKFRVLMDQYLAEIKAISKDIARKRANGRKTMARIDRNMREIDTILECVKANH